MTTNKIDKYLKISLWLLIIILIGLFYFASGYEKKVFNYADEQCKLQEDTFEQCYMIDGIGVYPDSFKGTVSCVCLERGFRNGEFGHVVSREFDINIRENIMFKIWVLGK